jgi:hypothetical protein
MKARSNIQKESPHYLFFFPIKYPFPVFEDCLPSHRPKYLLVRAHQINRFAHLVKDDALLPWCP